MNRLTPTTTAPRPRCRLMRLAFGGLLALLAVVAPAYGQGTTQTLPDPITTRQLNQFGDRMKLSDQQRRAIEPLHDDYKREFRVLRDGEIAEFLDSMRAMQGGGMPKREAVEQYLEQNDTLLVKIRLLDERLFDRMQPLLSESQITMLPRVRLARERQRYDSQQQMINAMGRRPVDLSEIFIEIDLPPDVFEATDTIIAQYERRLTNKKKELSRASSHMMLDLMDAIAEKGFGDLTEEDANDPQKMMEVMEVMQEVFANIMARSNEMLGELRELNERTYLTLTGSMPSDSARHFRNAYYRAAYPTLGQLITMDEQNWLDDPLARAKLTDAQREVLDAVAAGYRAGLDRMLIDGTKLADEQSASFSPFDFDGNSYRDYAERLAELNRNAHQLLEKTMATLRSEFGDELVDEMHVAVAQGANTGTAEELAAAEAMAAAAAEPGVHWLGGAGIPAPIRKVDLDEYADALALGDGQRDILKELHRSYDQQYRSLDVVSKLNEARASMWSPDSTRDAGDVDRVFDLRKQAWQATRAADDAFFDDVRVALAAPDAPGVVDRLRHKRRRSAYAIGAQSVPIFGADRSQEADVDLVSMLAEIDAPDEPVAVITGILDAYGTTSEQHLAARFDSQLEYRRATETWSLRFRGGDQDIAERTKAAMEYQKEIGPLNAKVGVTTQSLIDMNREALDEIKAALPADAAAKLQRLYDRSAYPSIFDDRVSVEEKLTAAMNADDLTGDQRAQLDELTAEYRPAYEKLRYEMRDIVRESNGFIDFENNDWTEYQAREERLERLRFDRRELNDRAIGRLRSVLDDAQIQRIGGLADPEG